MCDARRKIAARYSEAFDPKAALEIPVEPADAAVRGIFTFCDCGSIGSTLTRDNFMERLREKGIGCSVHFIPLHFHSYYQRRYGYQRGDFPRAEEEYRRCISLPIYPDLTKAQVERVISAVLETARECRRTKARAAHASA